MTSDIDNNIPIVEVHDLTKSFDRQKVLQGINLDVRRGEIMVVMGGSGCGKSTLLRHLIGSIEPDQGSVKLFGQEITNLNEKELNEIRKRFGILFQSGALFNSLTIPVLQEICRSRKLAVSGNKSDIITRIINFNEPQRELGSDVLPTFPQMDLIGQLEREFGCVAPATVWTSRVAASRWISEKITEKKARRQGPPQ